MDDIQYVVQQTLQKVSEAAGSLRLSKDALLKEETLAAFVAKTVVLDHADVEFQLDKELSREKLDQLVELSAARMLQTDSPSIDTIKMQVGFDLSYVASERKLEQENSRRKQEVAIAVRNIVCEGTRDDYDTINLLYRNIFHFLIVSCMHSTTVDTTQRKLNERVGGEGKEEQLCSKQDEREIAAALESVYPKIGLKSFVSLTETQKRNQLRELSSIVMGIRLFNRVLGKGGSSIPDIPGTTRQLLATLQEELGEEVEYTSETCEAYAGLLSSARVRTTAGKMRTKRWQDELTNKRQYNAYVSSLLEDVAHARELVAESLASISRQVAELKESVGSRASVPKEQVYPKFDAIAVAWNKLLGERQVLEARQQTFDDLKMHSDSFTSTLDYEVVENGKGFALERGESKHTENIPSLGTVIMESKHEESNAEEEEKQAFEKQEVKFPEEQEKNAEEKNNTENSDELNNSETHTEPGTENTENQDSSAILLSVHDTPEFLHLPLEYQGFCPWTIATRGGLLLPGNPSLGVVEFDNSFSVFVDKNALDEFLRQPQKCVQGVLREARRAPELIHLLHLQEHFPKATFAYLLYPKGLPKDEGTSGSVSAPRFVDVGTETPLHFVGKNIDPNYEFSEWALRRKVLQLANLRKKVTVSCQTSASHFRRTSEMQVYLPRVKGTQTGIDKATNPIRELRYVAGLRGNQGTKLVRGEPTEKDKISVVKLSFEL